jgi:crotonobetainyl-CoA:carnitine CoA-transferase CaiB-like acyl-CoA transferase
MGTGAIDRDPPLHGIRVLDLTKLLAGPVASVLLGELGAEIIKIEQPPDGDWTRFQAAPFVPGGEDSTSFASSNRGKKSVVLDIKHPEGLAVVKDLARECDVLLENLRAGALDRAGLDFETLSEINPRLIVCSISGFGQHGPYRDRTAVDLMIQAFAGAMHLTGHGDRPTRNGLSVGDLSGAVFAVIGILAALEKRHRTGRGERIDIALMDTLVSMLQYIVANQSATGSEPRAAGSGHEAVVPYQAFRAKDDWIVIACFAPRYWPLVCNAIDRPDLADDPRFATNIDRVRNRELLIPLLDEEIAKRTKQEWLAIFDRLDAPGAPIYTVSEVMNDPHVRHRRMVRPMNLPEGGTLDVVGNPLKFASVPDPETAASYPLLGEHTTEVLRDIAGRDPETIAALHEEGVIWCRDLVDDPRARKPQWSLH